MNMKKIIFGILVTFCIVGCSTEEIATIPEADTSFMSQSEQARLWNEIKLQSKRFAASGTVINVVDPINSPYCQKFGTYYTGATMTYTGGGQGNNFARLQKILEARNRALLRYTLSGSASCPDYIAPSFPKIYYNPKKDVYQEENWIYFKLYRSGMPTGIQDLQLEADESGDEFG